MSDPEEDYSSAEDSDYRPSGDNASDNESDVEQGEGNDAGTEKHLKKGKSKSELKRIRKGGIQLEGDVENTEETEEEKESRLKMEEAKKILEKEKEEEKRIKKEAEEKKKADDLWSSLLSDVGQRPKVKTKAESPVMETSQKEVETNNEKSVTKDEQEEKNKKILPRVEETPSKKTITITKEFDFAGEVVKVFEEVAADSKEAKTFLNKTQTTGQSASKPGISGIPAGLKRKPGGLGSVLGQINKKTKMGVLDKSKLDWNKFKQKEGIEEDLKVHNKGKDGFLERQNFLSETDLRQYEIERKMRMALSKR